jgi:transcriptional regulator with XRE-family HTH domain
MSTKRQPPSVRLRRLASELRRLRAAADLSGEDVFEATAVNKSTLYRIEAAKGRPHRRTLITLLALYKATDEESEYLLALLKEAGNQGWLQPYHSELPEEYTAYISFESEARAVRTYESLFIPGLLQTEDYARAVVRGTLPVATDTEVEDRVRARVERQSLLVGRSRLTFWAVVDEAAIRRSVGGPEVMRAQLAHLLEVSGAPNITLQVIPFGAGAHPGMAGQFILLEFPDRMDADLIYIDSMAGDLFLDNEADVRRYRSMFDMLVAMALSPKDSTALIADSMEGGPR